jgi:acetyl-CoA carboxylase carboxyl transferase subunit alpha
MAEQAPNEQSGSELEARLDEIAHKLDAEPPAHERRALNAERRRLQDKLNLALSAMDRVRLARNAARPQTLDYVDALITEFFEIHGDRRFADDGAIVAGLGFFGQRPVAIVGHQRGRSTAERLRRNFGKPHPEGYRKAARIFELADRFRIPLITFIDTQGAEPGVGAEERGQAEAIANNLELMARLRTPVISCVIGEGGSGGALALGVANVILMQEYACYSVITPEGCAAILWREGGPEKVADAAASLKLSAHDLMRLGIIDEIVSEPPGGAHREPALAASTLGASIASHLGRLTKMTPMELRRRRETKFAAMGSAFLLHRRVEKEHGIG